MIAANNGSREGLVFHSVGLQETQYLILLYRSNGKNPKSHHSCRETSIMFLEFISNYSSGASRRRNGGVAFRAFGLSGGALAGQLRH